MDLEKYDPKLLREYFLHFKPKEERRDLQWKLFGLIAYGKIADMAEIKKLLSAIPNETNAKLFELIIPAREGNREAMQKLEQAPNDVGVSLLPLCRTKAASDKLAEFANDKNQPFSIRYRAVEGLKQLGDNRSLEITISAEFIAAMEQSDGSISKVLSDLTGLELESINSREAALEWIKKNNFKIKMSEQKISVKDGIDWSKVKWE